MNSDSKKPIFFDYIAQLEADNDIPAWSGYMPEKQLQDKTFFFDLPAVLRALLLADGTVTIALEAIYKEQVQVQLVDQYKLLAEHAIPLLGIESGQEVFYREVTLKGKDSGKPYVQAYSLLKQNALSPDLWKKLSDDKVGMGVVLRNAAQGNFRKVLHIGAGDLGNANKGPSNDPNQVEALTTLEKVHRTYSVNIQSEAAILITEVFSLSALARD